MGLFDNMIKQFGEVRDRARMEEKIDGWFKALTYEQKIKIYKRGLK